VIKLYSKNFNFFLLIIIEQFIFSGTTFLISVLSGRWMTLYDYGLFAIIYSIIIFIGLVQDAIINQPLVIYSSNKYLNNSDELFYKILKILLTILILFIIATSISLVLFDGKLNIILQSMVIAIPGFVMMNFFRRVWHIKQKPLNNIITGLIFLICIVSFFIFYKNKELFSIINVFIAIGISSILCSLLSAYLFKREDKVSIATSDFLQYKEIFVNFFKYGKWALIASIFIWASNDIYYFVLSKYNMNSAGELKLIRNLFLPFIHVIVGINYYLLPRISKKLKNNSTIKFNPVLAMLLIASVIYSITIVIFSETIFDLVYNKRITSIHNLTSSCILIPMLFGGASLFTTFMRASENIRAVFFVHFLAVCISITFWLFVLKTISVYSSILTWNMTFLVIILLYYFYYNARMRHDN